MTLTSIPISSEISIFPEFSKSSNALAKKYLTEDIYFKSADLKTVNGFTLNDALKSGIENPDSSIGIYAGDEESYDIFSELFMPIIGDYHKIENKYLYSKSNYSLFDNNFDNRSNDLSNNAIFNFNNCSVKYHKGSDWSPVNFPKIDSENQYIISSRIRTARNFKKFPFTPIISLEHRKIVEQRAVKALKNMEYPFKGNYQTIYNNENNTLLNNNTHIEYAAKIESCPFKKGDRFQESAGINRDWPHARGIFKSDDNKFMVWINEEDHLRIMYIEKGGDIAGTFNNFASALNKFEHNLSIENACFSYNENLGYLTSCPSNIGTGIRISVHIKLPELFKNKELLEKTASKYQLQIRGTQGEKTEVESAIFDISNSQRLGVTERECCEVLYKGISEIIKLEKKTLKL